MLSLFYTGKGFLLFFCFSAVGHGFLLLIIEEGRGWQRMAEDGRGGKRKKEEGGGGKRMEADGKRRQAEAGGNRGGRGR